MRDLARSLRHSGEPVPVPWPTVGQYLKPRTQSVLIVLAASGVGKSTLALDWALQLGEPALYLSFDTALVDHAIRVTARSLNQTTEEIELGHDEDPASWAARYGPHLESLPYPVRFWDQYVAAETIGELVAAETEYWGEAPRLVVVDNLKNLVTEGESAGEYRRIISELLRIAKTHHTLVVALHHLRKKPPKSTKDDEDEDEGTKPVRLHDALYPVDQDAKYVLSLWRPDAWTMKVAILKNRMGLADANAKQVQFSLGVNMSRFQITDERRAA